MNILTNSLKEIEGSDQEEWVLKKPSYADHIKVERMNGIYTHHGIYVSDKEVIHYNTPDDGDGLGGNAEVISTSLKEFLKGGKVLVKIYNEQEIEDLYPAENIVAWARAHLGEGGYNLVFNNCEHFANMCTLGIHRSRQVENFLSPIPIPSTTDGEESMGILSGLFGGNKKREVITTVYEPDKVRVAEIEAQARLMVKKLESENIKIKAETQKELITHLVEQQTVLMQAKAEGFAFLAKEICQLSNNLIELRIEEQIQAEGSQNEAEQEISRYYNELLKLPEENIRDFELNHLPKLEAQRDRYEKDSKLYEMYGDMIKQRWKNQFNNLNRELDSFRKQREKRLDSNYKLREIMETHLNEINSATLKMVNDNQKLLELKDNEKMLLEKGTQQILEGGKKEEIEEIKTVNREIESAENEEVDENRIDV